MQIEEDTSIVVEEGGAYLSRSHSIKGVRGVYWALVLSRCSESLGDGCDWGRGGCTLGEAGVVSL